jgi:hypothetical protein
MNKNIVVKTKIAALISLDRVNVIWFIL